MSTKRKYSVTVLPDKDGEKFSKSSCNCDICLAMHTSQIEWNTFKPTTSLQYRMKEIINKLETQGIDKKRRIPKFD